MRPDGVGRACCEGVIIQSAKPPSQSFPTFRVFKTPGLRTPAAREQIYNISINGSPLADSKEISLTVPVGGGAVSSALGIQAPVCCTAKPLSPSCVPTPASEALKTPLSGWVLVTTPPQHSEPGALSQGQGPAGRTRAQPWVPSVSQLSSAALEKQLSGAVGVDSKGY